MDKPKIREIIVVEGRYDKNTLLQVVDATVIETDGFGIFSQKEKLTLLRRMAEVRGLILLLDSDSAGFLIRNHLKGQLPLEKLKQAYIPDIPGKERRKRTASKAGTLGVEGMCPAVLLQSLRDCGATFLNGEAPGPEQKKGPPITRTDLFVLGLSGTAGSTARRAALLEKLELPAGLTTNGMLEVLNLFLSREELTRLLKELEDC